MTTIMIYATEGYKSIMAARVTHFSGAILSILLLKYRSDTRHNPNRSNTILIRIELGRIRNELEWLWSKSIR
jgi:hypothetical protein